MLRTETADVPHLAARELETSKAEILKALKKLVARDARNDADGATASNSRLEPTSIGGPLEGDQFSEIRPLAWLIPSCIQHPLRSLIGNVPFFLLTLAPTGNNQDERSHAMTLRRAHKLTVGVPSPDSSARLACANWSGLAGKQSDRAVEFSITDRFFPLSLDDARFCVSMFTTAVSATEAPAWYPIFAYCVDDNGMQRFIGVSVEQLLKNGCLSTFHVFHITDAGLVASVNADGNDDMSMMEDEENMTAPIPLLAELLHRSEDVISPKKTPREAIAPKTYAEYEVLSGTGYDKDAKNPICLSSITLQVEWDGAQEVFAPPPVSAAVALSIKSVSGVQDKDSHVATRPMLNELLRLSEWSMALQTNGIWKGVPQDDAKLSTEIADMVDSFLDNIKAEGSSLGVEDATRSSDASANVAGDLFGPLPQRKDMDFTERFWRFCQAARTQDDLIEALTAVAEELESGKLKPMIHKSNHSSLANLIRDCLKLSRLQTMPDFNEQKEAVSRTFDFWLEQPLECIIEIGIAKLKRDYSHHLIGNDLASWAQLEIFLDATIPLQDQVHRLLHLHRVLEIWSLVRTNVLAIPSEPLRSLVQAALAHFATLIAADDNMSPSDGPPDHNMTDDETRNGNEKSLRRNERVHEPVVCTVYLPRFSSGTDKMLGSLVRSFEPSFWELSVRPKSSTATSTISGAEKNGSDRLPAFVVQLDRNDQLIANCSTDSALGGDDTYNFGSVPRVGGYRMVTSRRVI